MMILGQIAGMVASAIGRAMAEGDYKKAQALREQALAQYGEDILPHLEKAEAQEVGATEYGNIREDDSLRAQQLRAIQEMEGVYSSEGMTEADKAAMALAQQQVAQRAGSDYASMQQMGARRGINNSALQSAMYSQAGQDATNTLGTMANQSQIAARDRALRALETGAGMAGQVRGQDYRVSSDKAGAQDAINRFNANMRTDASNENARRQMQEANFNMGRLDRRTGVMSDIAAGHEGSAQRTQQTAAGVGQGVQQATGGYAQSQGDSKAWDDYLDWKKKNP